MRSPRLADAGQVGIPALRGTVVAADGQPAPALSPSDFADSGFELDGLDSSDTGTAVQPYECRAWPDMTGGLDNELDRIGSYDEMPLHTGLQAAITPATLSIAVNLDFFASGARGDGKTNLLSKPLR